MHTADGTAPEPSPCGTEIAIDKLKRYKSPGIDQIPTEEVEGRSNILLLRSINLLIVFGIRMNCHSSGRYLLLYLFIKRVIKLFVIIREG
jgi:hypothetical protein